MLERLLAFGLVVGLLLAAGAALKPDEPRAAPCVLTFACDEACDDACARPHAMPSASDKQGGSAEDEARKEKPGRKGKDDDRKGPKGVGHLDADGRADEERRRAFDEWVGQVFTPSEENTPAPTPGPPAVEETPMPAPAAPAEDGSAAPRTEPPAEPAPTPKPEEEAPEEGGGLLGLLRGGGRGA